MDFTIKKYNSLLLSLVNAGYNFTTLSGYLNSPTNKTIILRHDVDLLPLNSLQFAEIQANEKIVGVYNFRTVPKSFDETIIRQISELGHEIGYHYENMDICDGNIDKAWDNFQYNLDRLRKLVDIKTICMHGSPKSKFDNRDLWQKYDYKSLGIIGDPYIDIDWNQVYYLTDTGRRWDGGSVSVRDKVDSQNAKLADMNFHSTIDIINSLDKNKFPDRVMFTMHPQRWTNNMVLWTRELIWQNVKNQIKKYLIQ